MTDFDFYREMYFKELERKAELSEAVSIPIGIISGVLAGLFYLITSFDFSQHIILTGAFTLLVAIGTFFALRTVYFLIRSYINYSPGRMYSGIPYGGGLENYRLKLKEYYLKELHKTENDGEGAFRKYYFQNVIKHLDNNAYINDKRARYLYFAKANLFYTLIFVLLSCLPFFVNFFQAKEKIDKIEIVNSQNVDNDKRIIQIFDSLSQK
jgi:hypothetical protein